MATLKDMRDELGDHGFSDEPTERLDSIINDAYQDVCSREPWPFLESQVSLSILSGNDTPVLPDDFRSALTLTIDSMGVVIRPRRSDEIQKLVVGAATQPGLPYTYYFVGGDLRLWPIPDQNYTATLTYLQYPADLVADSDTPILPARHNRVIVLGALVDLYRLEDDPELAAVFEQQFEKRIGTMRNDLWMRQYDEPDTIDASGYDDDIFTVY